MLVRAEDSVLVIIDIQDKLFPAVMDSARTLQNTLLLLHAARRCQVPVLISEQFPEGLGKTVSQITEAAGDSPVFSKLHFSCMKEPGFHNALTGLGRRQAVLAGMESHVCVAQTAIGMIDQGFDVFHVVDATSSRTPESRNTAQTRLAAAGVQIVNTEMVVFEWLAKSGTSEFKALLPLIKQEGRQN